MDRIGENRRVGWRLRHEVERAVCARLGAWGVDAEALPPILPVHVLSLKAATGGPPLVSSDPLASAQLRA